MYNIDQAKRYISCSVLSKTILKEMISLEMQSETTTHMNNEEMQ